jgi:DNA-binding CsgD family transcriptional regulator
MTRSATILTHPRAHLHEPGAALRGLAPVAPAHPDALLRRYRALTAALHNLSGTSAPERLLPYITRELCRCGFTRAWLTAVSGSALATLCVHPDEGTPDAGWPAAHDVARGTHEADLLRRRLAILVTDTRESDRAILACMRPHSYVAVPLLAGTQVLALLHADRPDDPAPLTDEDLEIIAAFGEAVTHVLQRVLQAQRSEQLRAILHELADTVADTADTRCSEPLTLPGAAAASMLPSVASIVAGGDGAGDGNRLRALLTAREIEIVHLLAAGETNAGIARQLVISEGTVKSHVKSVLRKLHATNRAQAISRYFKLTAPR